MDISQISDIKELKALAYDELVAKERAETNLRIINQRILTLENTNIAPNEVAEKSSDE